MMNLVSTTSRIDRNPLAAALLVLALSTPALSPHPAEACVAPPPEPFCTKALTLAVAGPPTQVLAGGGTFDVPAVLIFKQIDFPAGSGICPAGPYTADVRITAQCDPAGADGSGALLGVSVGTGFNLLDVPVTVPAGPPRVCKLLAEAELTLADGMVLTESAEGLACLAEAASGSSALPRVSLELLNADSEIARAHPGDPVTRTYRITNNDPDLGLSGVLRVDSVGESRQPGSSGPMPEGTAVVSMADPVAGDNFSFAVSEGAPFAVSGAGAAARGGAGESCLVLGDPAETDIVTQELNIFLDAGEGTDVVLTSRSWGMCADGSCSSHDLRFDGAFSDLSPFVACSTLVSAADTSVPPAYFCDDSGQVGTLPPPPDPNLGELVLAGTPFPGFQPRIRVRPGQLLLVENGIPVFENPALFAELFDPELGRTQAQWSSGFQEDSAFDLRGEVFLEGDDSVDAFDYRVWQLSMVGAPTGLEAVAPFATTTGPVVDLLTRVQAFADITVQVNAVAIDTDFDRRPLGFSGVTLQKKADGSGLDFELTGGFLEEEEGQDLLAIELSFDLRGFLSPEPQGGIIFEDGFESGNISLWSISSP